jgi:hypothetical protein
MNKAKAGGEEGEPGIPPRSSGVGEIPPIHIVNIW